MADNKNEPEIIPLDNSSLPSARSFYGACHMKDLPSSEYWLDHDDGERFEVLPLWEWRKDDPCKTDAACQSMNCSERTEEYWNKRYPFPYHLVPMRDEAVFPVRVIKDKTLDLPVIDKGIAIGLYNAFLAEFDAEHFCTYSDIPQLWVGSENLIADAKARCRGRLAELESKLRRTKKRGLSGIININIVSFLQGLVEFRRAFFKEHPDANPYFYGYGDEYDVPTTICPEDPLYLQLVESQVRELLTECPSLDYIQLTIGDNGGYVNCLNPKHSHPKYETGSLAQIQKSIEIIHRACEVAESVRPITILCRCWCATYWTVNKMLMAKYGQQLPKKGFVLMGKLFAPPAIDNCPLCEQINPGAELWRESAFICVWGEESGVKNIFPLPYLYANPQKVQRDMKLLAKSGKTRLVMTNVDSLFTHEIDSLTVKACCWNPDFDLNELKEKWARLRFGKAWKVILDALAKTPEVVRKVTLYHDGILQRFSLHLVLWGGVRSPESVFHVPAPRWLADVNKSNFKQLSERIDPTAQTNAVLELCEEAKKIEPDNELVDLYLSQAQLTVNLASFFREYHMSFLEYRLAEKQRHADNRAAVAHIHAALGHLRKSMQYVERYDDDITLKWLHLPQRRYFVYFCRQTTRIIRRFLENRLREY